MPICRRCLCEYYVAIYHWYCWVWCTNKRIIHSEQFDSVGVHLPQPSGECLVAHGTEIARCLKESNISWEWHIEAFCRRAHLNVRWYSWTFFYKWNKLSWSQILSVNFDQFELEAMRVDFWVDPQNSVGQKQFNRQHCISHVPNVSNDCNSKIGRGLPSSVQAFSRNTYTRTPHAYTHATYSNTRNTDTQHSTLARTRAAVGMQANQNGKTIRH